MNTTTENDLTLVCPISFRRVESGRKRLNAGHADIQAASAPIPRISKLMALALRLDRLVRDGLVENCAALARIGGVSYARMTQILNLLNLAPDIQEESRFLQRMPNGHDPITEFEIRSLITETDQNVQRRRWAKIETGMPPADIIRQRKAGEAC